MWNRELDIYGRCIKGNSDFVLFLYQGQYYDKETQLAYNRFRYYDPKMGMYISQDPIGLAGGMVLYGYVHDVNGGVDTFGLEGTYAFIVDAKNKVAYVGKGKWNRFRKSLRQKLKAKSLTLSSLKGWNSKYYGNDDIAEMIESKVMEKLADSGYSLINKINSPGLNRLGKVGDALKDLVDKAADELISEMHQNANTPVKKGKSNY